MTQIAANPFSAFPIQPVLTAIAIAYRNNKLIGDAVLPRVQVSSQVFRYIKYRKQDGFTVPNTMVGRTGKPTVIDFGADQFEASTKNFALDDAIPQEDIDAASRNPLSPDPRNVSAEYLTNLVALDREIRVASLVFNSASYDASMVQTLSGTSQFSDFTNSDPISTIMAALDSMIMRGTIAVMGRAVYTKIVSHPKIVKAFNGTAGDTGIVPKSFLASLFELDDVLVGEGWVNTAKKGQTPSLTRVWGKNIALLYRDNLASAERGTTFGFTAQYGTKVAGSIQDPDVGMKGGVRVRSGESVQELVSANDLGYFIQNAIA